MLEKLYEILWIFSLVALGIYGILVVTFTCFKFKNVKNVRTLQNVTFLTMLTTIVLITVNFIFELMLEKSMIYDKIFYIASCIGTISLYYLAKKI